MDYTVIDGIMSGLERTTQVSGGGDTMATTIHISMFSLSGERVILKTKEPPMIADGDHLKLVGIRSQGQFAGVACKNNTTGWMTTHKQQSCVMALLGGFCVVGIIFTLIFPLFVFMPILFVSLFLWVRRADARMKRAHEMLHG